MILVRSLLQLLSGNKTGFLLLVIVLSLSSCSILKNRIDGQSEVGIDRNKNIDHSGNDTIIEEIVISEPKEIENKEPEKEIRQTSNRLMKVALILPFDAQTSEIKASHAFVMHFNEGVKRAMRSLQISNNPVEISIFDSKSRYNSLDGILTSLDDNVDLIIGGFSKSNIIKIAQYAERNKVAFVSPIYPSNSIVSDNPYHVQITPSLNSHFERLLQDVNRNYPHAEIKFIGRDNDKERSRVERMVEIYNKQRGVRGDSSANTIFINWENDNSIFNFIGKVKAYKTNVFIIPSWSSQSFIYSLMRQISIDKGKGEVVIYGMPQWKGFDLESYNYYENLQLHISSGAYISDKDTEKKLRRELNAIFNNIATEKQVLAYASGYDIAKYFGELLSEYGTGWVDKIASINKSGLAIDFELQKIGEKEALFVTEQQQFDRIENKAVKILVFENWKFNTSH